MTVITELTVSPNAFPLGELLQVDGDTRLDVTHVVSGEHSIDLYFWLTGTDYESFETALSDDTRIKSMTLLDHLAGKALYRLTLDETQVPLLTAILSDDLLVEAIQGNGETWRVRLRAADYDTLATFSQICDDLDVSVTIQKLYTGDVHDAPGYPITEKQYEVLQLAYEEGYFSVPRQTTLTELAHGLEISDSAVAQRLRRGLSTLLAHSLFPMIQPPEADD